MRSAGSSGFDEDFEADFGDVEPDTEVQRSSSGMQFDDEARDQGRHESGRGLSSHAADAEARRTRRYAIPASIELVDDTTRRIVDADLPGARTLFGTTGSTRTIDGPGDARTGPPIDADDASLCPDVARLVLALVLHESFAAAPRRLFRAALATSRAQLDRQRDRPDAELRLDGVRRLLLDARAAVWPDAPFIGDPSIEVGEALALLPLQLLNSARPRTPRQRRDALDRQTLLLKSGAMR